MAVARPCLLSEAALPVETVKPLLKALRSIIERRLSQGDKCALPSDLRGKATAKATCCHPSPGNGF